jgi:hypothetical protein
MKVPDHRRNKRLCRDEAQDCVTTARLPHLTCSTSTLLYILSHADCGIILFLICFTWQMFADSPSSTLLMVLKITPVKRRSKKLVPLSSDSPVASKKTPRIASAIHCATLIETGTAPESRERIDK